MNSATDSVEGSIAKVTEEAKVLKGWMLMDGLVMVGLMGLDPERMFVLTRRL